MQLANKQTKIFVIIITSVAQVIIIFGDGKPKEAITTGQGVAADNVKGSHVCVIEGVSPDCRSSALVVIQSTIVLRNVKQPSG